MLPLALYAAAFALTRAANDHYILLVCTRVINALQYAVLLAAIASNLHIGEIRLMGLGTFFNFLALAANAGVMPVHPKAAELAGISTMFEPSAGIKLIRHVIMTPETQLKPLTDIIPLPGFSIFLKTVVSVGDILLAIGIFLLVQRYMCFRGEAEK